MPDRASWPARLRHLPACPARGLPADFRAGPALRVRTFAYHGGRIRETAREGNEHD